MTSHCVTFDSGGTKIYGGFKKSIAEFDITRPCEKPVIKPTVNKNKAGQKAIISSIDFAPYYFNPHLFVTGSYDGNSQLFDRRCHYPIAMFKSHPLGITQVKFSPCGQYLCTGARKGNDIICYSFSFTLSHTLFPGTSHPHSVERQTERERKKSGHLLGFTKSLQKFDKIAISKNDK